MKLTALLILLIASVQVQAQSKKLKTAAMREVDSLISANVNPCYSTGNWHFVENEFSATRKEYSGMQQTGKVYHTGQQDKSIMFHYHKNGNEINLLNDRTIEIKGDTMKAIKELMLNLYSK